jgi:hypothetical protein
MNATPSNTPKFEQDLDTTLVNLQETLQDNLSPDMGELLTCYVYLSLYTATRPPTGKGTMFAQSTVDRARVIMSRLKEDRLAELQVYFAQLTQEDKVDLLETARAILAKREATQPV